MANLVYKNQPATKYMVDEAIYDLVRKLANSVEQKRKNDPSFDEIAILVNQIADNLINTQGNINETID